jgi:hypothetical protein
LSTPEEVDAIVNWYKSLSDETKNYWTFRWTRVEDPAYKELYETMKAAEKLHRAVRSAEKKTAKAENYRKQSEHDNRNNAS